jgi:hypothetical protein
MVNQAKLVNLLLIGLAKAPLAKLNEKINRFFSNNLILRIIKKMFFRTIKDYLILKNIIYTCVLIIKNENLI